MTHAYAISEVSARSPDMSDREFAEFVEDIRVNGQLVPIWIRGDEVIDGRKRLAACRQLGIEPAVVNLDPSQDGERISRALNVLRTHYSPSQRAMMGEMRANLTDGQRADKLRTNTQLEPITVEQAAREVGVSRSYISKARQVIEHGAPELVDAVKAGRLTINSAREILVAVPKPEQASIAAKVIESSAGKQRQTPVAKILEGVDPRRDRAIPKPAHEQFARAVQMMDVASEIVAKHADAATTDARRREFTETLRQVRTTISQAIKLLEVAA